MYSLTLLAQQFRLKLGSLAIWTIVWSLLLLLFSSVFNSLSDDAEETAKVFESLPKELYGALNINPSAYLTSIENFLSGQFLFVYMLAGTIFAFALGVGAIGKRIENGTIANFLTRPLPRGDIYIVQWLVNCLFLAMAGALVGGIAWLIFDTLLTGQDIISEGYFFWTFTGTTLLFITFATLGQLVGTLMNGGRSLAVGAAIAVASYFINALGAIAELPQWLQSVSLFHYLDVATLRDEYVLNGERALYLVGFTLLFVLLGWLLFRRKDIYI
ncbi:ABC transporter permease subunit [Candidatus Saccharibacteria bacterium]|nr:ABC transporter permease subunit [Candidatus Saccharibacteria bacterium]